MKIPLLNTKGHMSDKVGRKLQCVGTEGIEEVLKTRGWSPEAGPALVMLASTKDGKIESMRLATIGDNITVSWELDHLWQGVAKVKTITSQHRLGIMSLYFSGLYL